MSHPRSSEIRVRLKELDSSANEMRIMLEWAESEACMIMLRTLRSQKSDFEADLFECASKKSDIPGALVGRIEQVDSQIRWIEDGFKSQCEAAQREHATLVEELKEIGLSERETDDIDSLETEQVATV